MATPLPDRDRCVFHADDGGSRKRMAEGRRRGGLHRLRPSPTLPADTSPPLKLETIADAKVAVAALVNDVRVGRLGAREGNCMVAALSLLVTIIKGDEMERRLAALEERHTQANGRLNR